MLQYSLFLSNRFGFCPWSSREMRLLICVHEEKCFLLFVCLFVCTKTPATQSEGSLRFMNTNCSVVHPRKGKMVAFT